MRTRLVVGSLLVTIAVLVAAATDTITPSTAAALDSAMIGSFFLGALLTRLRPGDASSSEFDRGLKRVAIPVSFPSDFIRARRLVGGALDGDENLRDRFVPYFRSIVAQRLATRHGIDLARSPKAAQFLSAELYQLIMSEPVPAETSSRRLSLERLEHFLAEVERI
jgi:hypothetical protein